MNYWILVTDKQLSKISNKNISIIYLISSKIKIKTPELDKINKSGLNMVFNFLERQVNLKEPEYDISLFLEKNGGAS